MLCLAEKGRQNPDGFHFILFVFFVRALGDLPDQTLGVHHHGFEIVFPQAAVSIALGLGGIYRKLM
ncbi:MAG: hypothetical protein V4719_06190 [Planctomycetota bacterium]